MKTIPADIQIWLAALLIVVPVGQPWVKPVIALLMVLLDAFII